MKKILIILVVFSIIILLLVKFIFLPIIKDRETTIPQKINKNAKVNINMKISSPAFEPNAKLPNKYTCDGENINPPLLFSNAPQNAKSLVLILEDPDAPMGTFVHWIVYNIDPQIKEIKENSLPEGAVEGINTADQTDYISPCPPASQKLQRGEPSGVHHYIFKLYALDTVLNFANPLDKNKLLESMKNHILDQAELIGLYGRK